MPANFWMPVLSTRTKPDDQLAAQTDPFSPATMPHPSVRGDGILTGVSLVSRNRSTPLEVATQTVPSLSSNISLTWTDVRPSLSAINSVNGGSVLLRSMTSVALAA